MAGVFKLGTLQIESQDGLSLGSITHGNDDIIALDKPLAVEGGRVANPILASYTVTGSAVTSIDFQGLDINAHGGSYEIELRIINTSGATAINIRMYMNGDTTDGNYTSQYLQGNTSSVSTGAQGAPVVTIAGTTQTVNSFVQLSVVNGYPRAQTTTGYSGAVVQIHNLTKIAAVSNITQLTFTSSTASTIGVGSQIIIRRKDV